MNLKVQFSINSHKMPLIRSEINDAMFRMDYLVFDFKNISEKYTSIYKKIFMSSWLNPHMHKMGPRGPKWSFLAIIFTQKMTESSGPMYSSTLMLGNVWYYHFAWSGPNSQKIVNLFQFSSGPWGPTIGTKFTISWKFGPLQVKW